MDKQREARANVLADDEVRAETEELQKQNSALEAECSELHRQLADQSAIADDADDTLRSLDALSGKIDDEQARRATVLEVFNRLNRGGAHRRPWEIRWSCITPLPSDASQFTGLHRD
jgi:hypothetical protein